MLLSDCSTHDARTWSCRSYRLSVCSCFWIDGRVSRTVEPVGFDNGGDRIFNCSIMTSNASAPRSYFPRCPKRLYRQTLCSVVILRSYNVILRSYVVIPRSWNRTRSSVQKFDDLVAQAWYYSYCVGPLDNMLDRRSVLIISGQTYATLSGGFSHL